MHKSLAAVDGTTNITSTIIDKSIISPPIDADHQMDAIGICSLRFSILFDCSPLAISLINYNIINESMRMTYSRFNF